MDVIIQDQGIKLGTGPANFGDHMPLVYKITNSYNNKVYIGWTGRTLEDRWNDHQNDALKNRDNRKFYNAIRKYGTEIWSTEILIDNLSITEAKEKEKEYIKLFDSYNHGYNATRGGDGNNGIVMSKESNEKRSAALKGVKKSESTVEKFRKRKSTPESNLKRSIAHKGTKKPWVKWNKNQIAKRAMTRRTLTHEGYLEIHKLRNEGLLIKEIAARTNLSTDIVKKWLKKEWNLYP